VVNFHSARTRAEFVRTTNREERQICEAMSVVVGCCMRKRLPTRRMRSCTGCGGTSACCGRVCEASKVRGHEWTRVDWS